jgi:arylsulfatase A-like enzyme
MPRQEQQKPPKTLLLTLIVFLAVTAQCNSPSETPRSPNVILIITDDQGYGDLGIHGNRQIRTPVLDQLARQSIEMTQFYVSPVCAPTRASLMTGRYNYRTGVTETYLGRALMYTEEVTLAELLKSAGYRTGIFGKWHLGDNYPLRPMDQGFEYSLVHRGGGIGQPSDPPGNSYFSPVLSRNGDEVTGEGYCTDVFFNAAIRFIETNQDQPFFVYLSTNAPHTPLQISDEYVQPYLAMGLDETTARVYAMVTNIDDNMAKLLARLEELELAERSILVFMTDNGHQQDRYSAGLRGRKASVFEGGIRVPFFVRWPGRFEPNQKIHQIAAHIDVVPTILDACGVTVPAGLKLDGVSLMPVWSRETDSLPERFLFFQAHRGDVPELGRACAVRSSGHKLVQPEGWRAGPGPENPPWMLFDMKADWQEQQDLSAELPEIVSQMRGEYEQWFDNVSSTRGYDPPRIHLGSAYENPVILTRQDWRGPRASWSADGLGHWEIQIVSEGQYQIQFRFAEAPFAGQAQLLLAGKEWTTSVPPGTTSVVFEDVNLETAEGRLEAILRFGEKTVGAHYVDVTKK